MAVTARLMVAWSHDGEVTWRYHLLAGLTLNFKLKCIPRASYTYLRTASDRESHVGRNGVEFPIAHRAAGRPRPGAAGASNEPARP